MKIGYAWVTTQEQTRDFQLDALKTAGCDPIYQETVSSRSAQRPELVNTLAYARPGDTFILWKLDRAARSTRELFDLAEDLEQRKVGFVSFHDHLDTTPATGRLFSTFMAALAEFERDLIQERTLAGLAATRARGREGGRPRSLSKKKLEKAAAMVKGGISLTEAARTLRVSPSTMSRHLSPQGEFRTHEH